MAKRHMPWEEILLWSLLGGVFIYGLSWVGLALYREIWDEEALRSLIGDRWTLYSFGVVGTGALLTAAVLWFGARRETPAVERRELDKRRRR